MQYLTKCNCWIFYFSARPGNSTYHIV